LTTVADKVIHEEVDQAIIDGQVRILHRKLEVIIRLVQLSQKKRYDYGIL
jgi:hypothetical protein